MEESPVTAWIRQLREGDPSAAQQLWQRYFPQMVNLARRRLEGAARAVADEEDVALSAFRSFCLGARAGRFPDLMDSDGLWPLLMAITANKSVDLVRHNNRLKRGGPGPVRAEPLSHPLSQIIGADPTPEFAAELSDQLQLLLQRLDATGDSELRRIALLKMDGFSNQEIAEEIGCVRRSVERKLQMIARLWEKDDGS